MVKFREMLKEEEQIVYEMGYNEWSGGMSWDEYSIDNKREEKYGTRYVYLDDNGIIVGSLILLSLSLNILNTKVYAIASVIVKSEFRNKGYGKSLIKDTINLISSSNPFAIFLYSEIETSYYSSIGFELLPESIQNYNKKPCMIYCNDKNIINNIINLEINIPLYF
jgi:predicted N-acetyltransferase YhbS